MTDRHRLSGLHADRLSLGYDGAIVVDDLTLALPVGRITALVGPNASGKSTLLRGLARLLHPQAGSVFLDGRDIHSLPTADVARRLGILPQAPTAPDGLLVEDLVARGRYPHQSWLRQWSEADEEAVASALRLTRTEELRHRPVDELSGGQRQRAWIAMALAQETELMLLDEPTTYLDMAHQIEVLDLLQELNTREGRTIVLVLHDLNQASRYADHLVAMRDGRIRVVGRPADVVSEAMVVEVFGVRSRVIPDPVTGTPMVVAEAPTGRAEEPLRS